MTKPVRILIVDDHEVVLRGVRALLHERLDWRVCGEATTGREAVAKAIVLVPDLVILDVSMPDLNGIEAARRIRRALPQTSILALTVHDMDTHVRDLLDAGVHGYVSKADAGQLLMRAVDAVLHKRSFFSSRISSAIKRVRLDQQDHDERSLTLREREILQLLAEGHSNKDIGSGLNISVKTVETHRARILKKLHVHSMNALVRYAIRNRLIEA
jgi:DNA-binding NarL/FixJ family response regulator